MSRYNDPKFKYYFNEKKFYEVESAQPYNRSWTSKCDKKLVKFESSKVNGRCEGFVIHVEWCDQVIDE